MMRVFFRKISIIFTFALCLAIGAPLASAATPTNPGCDDTFAQAQKDRNAMLRLRDSSVAKQLVAPRASVIEMTCFRQASEYAARGAGNIFTGSFQGDPNFLGIIIATARSMIQGNFQDNIMSQFSVAAQTAMQSMASGIACNA